MRHRPKQRGFTIIEILIFLAVSGFIFSTAIGQYTSQQRNVNFSQGVRDTQALISTVANESASSFAPDISQYTCSVGIGSLTFTNSPPLYDNSACIFLGRAITVGYGAGCDINNPDKCRDEAITSIVGARNDVFAMPVTSYAAALPKALTGGGSVPYVGEQKLLNNNIGVYRTFVRDPSGGNLYPALTLGTVAFMFNLSGGRVSNNLNLLYLPLATTGYGSITTAINNISTGVAGTSYYVNPTDGITMCIKDGNGKLSAISIGAGNSPLDVQVENSNAIDGGC